MSEVDIGCGPISPVEGPPPLRPLYGLLQAADASAAASGAVRLVTDTDESGRERWLNGIEILPYPVHAGAAHNPWKPGTGTNEKSTGEEIQNPQYGAFTAYVADTCSSFRAGQDEQFRARLFAVLDAVEGAVVAEQLLTGSEAADTVPFLADGNGVFPNADVAVGLVRAVSILTAAIAASRRQGVIHMSPQAAELLNAAGSVITDDRGVLRTITGRLVVPDDGYTGGANPEGHAAAGATQEWMYASGPVDIRRSAAFVVPDTMGEAMDRGLGGGSHNDFTFRAERHYLVSWDTAVQAAVLADRCADDCP